MDINEFRNLFPDEEICRQYLEKKQSGIRVEPVHTVTIRNHGHFLARLHGRGSMNVPIAVNRLRLQPRHRCIARSCP